MITTVDYLPSPAITPSFMHNITPHFTVRPLLHLSAQIRRLPIISYAYCGRSGWRPSRMNEAADVRHRCRCFVLGNRAINFKRQGAPPKKIFSRGPFAINILCAVCTDCCIQNRTQIVFLSFPLLLCLKLVLTTMADRRCWYDIPYAATIMFIGRP